MKKDGEATERTEMSRLKEKQEQSLRVHTGAQKHMVHLRNHKELSIAGIWDKGIMAIPIS